MSLPVRDGITAATISSARLATRVLFSGPDDGIPVLFLHGNLSAATWWESTMVRLPPQYRGIAPDQRGFGDADPAPASSPGTRSPNGSPRSPSCRAMQQASYSSAGCGRT